jgi:menaquinone-dependent protoporphyrinogen oxidase
MDKNILVTYASKYGATKEIAEKIGEVLRQAGLQPDVIPVDGIRDITPYKAVILGSAIYIGKWLKEAVAFLEGNEKSLAERVVWLFSSGPTGEGDPLGLIDGKRLPAELQPVAGRIRPRDIVVFGGYINPDRVNFIEKMAVKNLVKKPFGDFRDWHNIITWSTKIAEALKNGDG